MADGVGSPAEAAFEAMLQLHNEAMSSGLLHAATEALPGDLVARAAGGFRYFGRDDVAAVIEWVVTEWERLRDGDGDDAAIGELERQADIRYHQAIPNDAVLDRMDPMFGNEPDPESGPDSDSIERYRSGAFEILETGPCGSVMKANRASRAIDRIVDKWEEQGILDGTLERLLDDEAAEVRCAAASHLVSRRRHDAAKQVLERLSAGTGSLAAHAYSMMTILKLSGSW